jgi:hypothetical protein
MSAKEQQAAEKANAKRRGADLRAYVLAEKHAEQRRE